MVATKKAKGTKAKGKKGKVKVKVLTKVKGPAVLKASKHQIGTTNEKRDKSRKAMKPGKRVSKKGNIYYEYRRNRSDKSPRKGL